MAGPMNCPVCHLPVEDLPALSDHLVGEAGRSDADHVMWLNRNVTKHQVPAAELRDLLAPALFGTGSTGDRVAR